MRGLIFTLVCGSLSINTAHGLEHKIDVLSYAASFDTEKGTVNKSVISPIGAILAYEFRNGFFDSYSAQYSLLSSGKKVLIQGLTFSANYVLYGGNPKVFTFPKNTVVRYEFPFRFSVFGGLAARIYDVSSMYPKGKIVIPSSAALEKGKFIGGEFGFNAERGLWGPISINFQSSYLIPYFLASANQKGSLIALGAGIGTRF